MMNNLSDLTSRGPPPDNIRYATSWASQAKGVIEKTKASARSDAEGMPACEQTLAAVLYNLGMLLEVRHLSREDLHLFNSHPRYPGTKKRHNSRSKTVSSRQTGSACAQEQWKHALRSVVSTAPHPPEAAPAALLSLVVCW